MGEGQGSWETRALNSPSGFSRALGNVLGVHDPPILFADRVVYLISSLPARLGLPWWLRWLSLLAMLETWFPSLGQEEERIPWGRAWQPTPVLLPGESHGQRSLVGYSPWGRKGVRQDWAANTLTLTTTCQGRWEWMRWDLSRERHCLNLTVCFHQGGEQEAARTPKGQVSILVRVQEPGPSSPPQMADIRPISPEEPCVNIQLHDPLGPVRELDMKQRQGVASHHVHTA